MGLGKRSLAVVLFAVWLPIGACSEEDEAPPPLDPDVCKLLGNRCHPYDVEGGDPLARECHDIGHDAESLEKCNEIKAACLAVCPLTDGGHTGGSGGTGGGDAGGDASSGGTAGTGDPRDSGADAVSDTGNDAAGSGGTAGGGSGGTSGSGGTGGSAGYGGSAGTACDQLGSKCHGIGPGFTEQCHALGHDGNEPACEAQFEACIAACTNPG
jgi:hypothetical protein